MECPLCSVIERERLVYKDDHCFCMVNYEPLNRTHLMVLPIRHVQRLDELNDQERRSILDLLERLSDIILKNEKDPPFICLNRGENCSQDHLHFHIISTIGLRWLYSQVHDTPIRERQPNEVLSKIAERFAKLLE